VAHDGSEGLSPDGWLPDRISVGVLTRVFTPELVDAAIEDHLAGQPEIRQSSRSEVPSDELHPKPLSAASISYLVAELLGPAGEALNGSVLLADGGSTGGWI
jgi:hypothetical protein